MTLPDFSKVPLSADRSEGAPHAGEPWLTPEGIAVKRAYTAKDRAGLDFVDSFPGLHVRETICSADLAPAATSIGLELERLIVGDRCLYRAVAANEDCTVVDETGDEPAVAIAKCGGGASTCWEIKADAACGSGFRLDVARTQPAPADTFTTLRCHR